MAIRATFYGFEMARSALTASQRSIDVTGQNISNINTAGYSRQRVDLSSVGAGGINWKHGLSPAENVGMGVNINGIRRIRDSFLDIRYRKELGDNTRYTQKAGVLGQLEGMLDEITTDNIDSILSDFQGALQELNGNADDVNFAGNVRMIANTFAKTLNKLALDIKAVYDNQFTELGLVKDEVNQLSAALNDVNLEIRNQMVSGVVSNELLDIRDNYIDRLSQYGNVNIVDAVDDEGRTTGGITVYFGIGEGEEFGAMLVNGERSEYNTLEFDSEYTPARLTWETGDSAGDDLIVNKGSIMGYYEMINGTGDVSEVDDRVDISSKGIPFYMNMLNNIASTFSETFNNINNGVLFDSSDGEDITALNIKISKEWQDDPFFFARTTSNSEIPGESRNDNIARFITALKTENIEMPDGFVGSFQQYVKNLNSEIAIEVDYNNKLLAVSDGLLLSVENLKESIMGVSEDEEAMNLSKYQKSYSAAARFMTVLDEMLDRIISNLGIVGR